MTHGGVRFMNKTGRREPECLLSPCTYLRCGHQRTVKGSPPGALLMIAFEGPPPGLADAASGPDHPFGVPLIAVDRPGRRVSAGRIELARGLEHGVVVLGFTGRMLITASGVEDVSVWSASC